MGTAEQHASLAKSHLEQSACRTKIATRTKRLTHFAALLHAPSVPEIQENGQICGVRISCT